MTDSAHCSIAGKGGAIDERTVHEAAEEMWERYPGDVPIYAKDDPRSIALAVVEELSILNVQLMTSADVPAFLEFLATTSEGEVAAWEKWLRYMDEIDYERRRSELADRPYYSPAPLPNRTE